MMKYISLKGVFVCQIELHANGYQEGGLPRSFSM